MGVPRCHRGNVGDGEVENAMDSCLSPVSRPLQTPQKSVCWELRRGLRRFAQLLEAAINEPFPARMLDFPHRAPQRLPRHGCYIAFQAYRGERFYHVFQARRAVPSLPGAMT